jgi:Na+-driven multidrug efflux pump
MVHLLKASIIWVWLSYVFSDVTEALVMLIYYRKGKWEKKRA